MAGLGFVKGLVKGKSLSDSSYGVPDATYAVPESSYGAPESSYGAPDLNYGAPEPTYGAPHQTYATPEDTHYTTPEEENDEYGSPTAPAIVELIKAEKLEEHSESGAELLQENAVDKVLIGTPQDDKMIKMGIRGGLPKKSSCSFGFCPNYLNPLPLIWKTCTTFFERQCPKKFG